MQLLTTQQPCDWPQGEGGNATFDNSLQCGNYQTGTLFNENFTPALVFFIGINDTMYGWVETPAGLNLTGVNLETGIITSSNIFPTVTNLRGGGSHGDGLFFFGSQQGTVYALNDTSGTVQWTFTTGGVSTVSYSDGMVFANSFDGNVYAINATDGTSVWTSAGISGTSSPPSVRGGVVYDNSASAGDVVAFNETNGDVIWTSPGLGGAVPSNPGRGRVLRFSKGAVGMNLPSILRRGQFFGATLPVMTRTPSV